MPRYPRDDEAARAAKHAADLIARQAKRDAEKAARDQARREFEASEEARKLDERNLARAEQERRRKEGK